MKNKKQNFGIGLIMIAVSVVMLGADRLFVSANSSANLFQSFSLITIIALFIMLVAVAWLYFLSYR